MTTSKAPFWWRGSQDEWNAVPVGSRELVASMKGEAQTKEVARLLAVVRNEHYKPEQETAKSKLEPTNETVAKALTGIRNWTESVDGIPATRVRDCIVYLLDVKKDPWYKANCNNRAFVHRFATQMNEQTPDYYRYDPNAVLGVKARHIDGEQHPVMLTVVQKKREDMTEKDRIELRDQFGVCDATVHYLAKPDCKWCHGKGFMDVSDYPGDPLYEKLASSEPCYCLWK